MHIEVEDCPDVHFVPYIIKSVEFYAEKLIPDKRTRNSITVYVNFDPDLDMLAYCHVTDYNRRKKATTFTIELHSGLGSRRIFESIAHEMVHVKQYISGELNESMTAWKGKKVDSDSIDYYDRPWEIESHGKETGLLSGFVTKYNLYEIFSDLLDPNGPIDIRPIAWKNPNINTI